MTKSPMFLAIAVVRIRPPISACVVSPAPSTTMMSPGSAINICLMKHEVVAWTYPNRQGRPAEHHSQIAVIRFQSHGADMTPEAIAENRHWNRPKRFDGVAVQPLARIDDIARGLNRFARVAAHFNPLMRNLDRSH
jgi:hypothetical protein